MRHCLIFDLDGLLFDSEAPTFAAMQQALADRGIMFTKEDYRFGVGLAFDDMVTFFRREYNIADAPQMLTDVFERARFVDGHYPPLKTGAEELLQTAQDRGLVMAIGTSSEREVALNFTRAANIEQYFSVIVGGDDVERRKPHPDIYLKALELLSLSPDDAVVLEDSHHGITSACAARIRAIYIPDLFPTTAETARFYHAEYPSLAAVARDIEAVLAD